MVPLWEPWSGGWGPQEWDMNSCARPVVSGRNMPSMKERASATGLAPARCTGMG